MYADQVTDLINELLKVHFESDQARKAELEKKLQTETLPNNLKLFEARLDKNNGYLSGKTLTYADVCFYIFNFYLILQQKKTNTYFFFFLVAFICCIGMAWR